MDKLQSHHLQPVECAEQYDKPMDECGVVGVWAPAGDPATLALEGMRGLQHRGQSGAGLAIYDEQLAGFRLVKGQGAVDAVLADTLPHDQGANLLDRFGSAVAVGHTRYSTSALESSAAAQPFAATNVLAHNGHVNNISQVAVNWGVEVASGVTDSHMMSLLVEAVAERYDNNIIKTIHALMPEIDGAYCMVVSDGSQLVAVRDPWGLHPLALGRIDDGYMVASEPVALADAGAEWLRDIEPGEIVAIDDSGIRSEFLGREEPRMECMIEYVYTARPEGRVNGVSVYLARKHMGRLLAEDYPVTADVVVGVPSSGLASASGYAEAAGIPRVDGIMLSPYHSSRSFIERGDKRAGILNRKFRINEDEVAGRRVVLVDDSLIKGNTMKALVAALRRAGAAEIHARFAAPKYLHPCYMGLDTGDPAELLARSYNDVEMCIQLGLDSIGFSHPQRIEQAVATADKSGQVLDEAGRLCMACATGKYPFDVSRYDQSQASHGPISMGMPSLRRT